MSFWADKSEESVLSSRQTQLLTRVEDLASGMWGRVSGPISLISLARPLCTVLILHNHSWWPCLFTICFLADLSSASSVIQNRKQYSRQDLPEMVAYLASLIHDKDVIFNLCVLKSVDSQALKEI